jgi:3-hydroxybutyryl-CoA dehydrogenase
MFDSSIRVAILSTSGHPPFPESGTDPFTLNQIVDFKQFISTEADLYIAASPATGSFSPEDIRLMLPLAAKPVLVNAVDFPGKLEQGSWFRYNGWPGFGSQPILEIGALGREIPDIVLQFAMAAGLTCVPVPDRAGLVRPRILAMIINEAFLALEEELSSAAEIDTAMRLGTGYPFGPFEWAEQIGLHRILKLLDALAAVDPKYSPAPALLKAAGEYQQKTV